MKLRTRIAPTPSGYLHLGNAWSFVLTWLAARSQGGKIHLRIDDLDAARYRDEYLEDIFETLHWLGLDWDSGPQSAEEFKVAYSQRLRLVRYQEALDALQAQRKLYACSCSREQIRCDAEAAGLRVYPGTCRDKDLKLDEDNHALRIRIRDSVKVRDESGKVFDLHPERDMGDVVLRQKNGDPSYQLASVLDDEDAAVNFVVRGLDLMPSTGAQLALAHSLELKTLQQARFWHHALVSDDLGGKLSKSEGAESLRAIREKFSEPEILLRFFSRHMGIAADEIRSIHDLISGFRMEKVATMPLKLSDFLRESGG